MTPRNSKRFYKISYINIPSIPWMNIFSFKKVKYIHMNWIDTRMFWHARSFSFPNNLYYISVCLHN